MFTVGMSLPAVFGTDVPKGNYADLTTKGFELSVSWRDQFQLASKPFNYEVRFTLADYQSTIDKYNNPEKKLGDDYYYEGMKVGEIWGYETEGFFTSQADIDSHAKQPYFYAGATAGQWLPGDIKFKDLNGDGIPDYIYNDTEGKRVYTRTYLGGDRFEEQTLVKDLDVTDIHCYDFDKDGDVDILLTFDYLYSSSFSFLLFAENTGGGHFTLHEYSFASKWAFGACLDVDNDGFMELLAGKQGLHYGSEESSGSVEDLYLFRLDNMKNVKEPNDILVAGTFGYDRSANSTTNWKETVISGLTENVILADIDNDGYLDILADTSRLFGNHFEPNEVVGYWKVQDLPLLQGIPANEAPQRMAAPSINLDRKSGKLKIAWQQGKDKETSTVDLTYALRIGSAEPVGRHLILRGRMPTAAAAISAPATWEQIWMPRWM